MSNKDVDGIMGHQAEPVIKAWVREHEKNQRNGNALTDAVKPANISPEGIAEQREEGGKRER